jgi:putative ABC transport system ATP-binding protein
MFTLKNVRYKHILDIESLQIPAQKITCIVGESGSGKTTLLKLLNKLISCDSGSIYYNEENLKALSSVLHRREVVMLPQVPTIFPGTIRDNLQIGRIFSEKASAEDEQCARVLEEVRLHKDLNEAADKLSGGEHQRLALARVLLMEPEVLLLDEPSASLDEDTEQLIIDKLAAYCAEQNRTLIMVTHSKKAARAIADYMIEIKDGKVLQEGVVQA